VRRRNRSALARSAFASASVVAALVGPARAEPGAAPEPGRNPFDVVILDAGHGGEDDGARGRGGLVEKDLVLDVARRLAARLRELGLRVVLTREGDRFVPLEARTSVANDARGDLFISIHANWAPSEEAKGIETFFVSLEATDEWSHGLAARENQAFGPASATPLKLDPLSAILGDMAVNEHVRESSGFAKLAHAELSKVDPVPSRGVKQAPFVVLMGVRMPAALVEIGFLSNRDDERALIHVDRREALAAALARAVGSFGSDHDKSRGIVARGPRQP
jgi:N-acetylmuramoyl-L-alanine amidase